MSVLIVVFILALLLYAVLHHRNRYHHTDYYKQTRLPLSAVRQDKGLSGEYETYRKLRHLRGYHRFLFNLYVPAEAGETTEIDQILLHESGIYVLEVKNYTGWIDGTAHQRCWTRTDPDGTSAPHYFYNPVLQNKGHIRWLHTWLKDRTLPIYSVVIFGDGCTLREVELEEGQQVVYLRKAKAAIRRHARRVGKQLTPDEIDRLYERLYWLTQADEETKRQHIEDVRRKRKRHSHRRCWLFRWLFRRRRCPLCGAKLVIRRAQTGDNAGHKVLGCSNYPQCRYTQDL